MRTFVNAAFGLSAIFVLMIAIAAPKPAEAELTAVASAFTNGVGTAGSGYLDTLYLSQQGTVERGFIVASAD